MAVAITVSTNGRFKVISSVNSTLVTAISEVITQLEKEQVSHNQTQFSFTHDGTNYVYLANVKL